MTINQIIALAGAGFTKNDILTIANQNTQQIVPAQVPTSTPTSAQTPATVSAPVQAPVTTPVQGQVLNNTPDTFTQGVQAMNGRLDTIASLLQQNNILNSQIPAQPTTDDMLASIINPPNLAGGDK